MAGINLPFFYVKLVKLIEIREDNCYNFFYINTDLRAEKWQKAESN